MIRENLLEVILDNQSHFRGGLCAWSNRLYRRGIISEAEMAFLDSLLEEERDVQDKLFLEYLWPTCEISYRIEWLKSKLEKK